MDRLWAFIQVFLSISIIFFCNFCQYLVMTPLSFSSSCPIWLKLYNMLLTRSNFLLLDFFKIIFMPNWTYFYKIQAHIRQYEKVSLNILKPKFVQKGINLNGWLLTFVSKNHLYLADDQNSLLFLQTIHFIMLLWNCKIHMFQENRVSWHFLYDLERITKNGLLRN